MCKVFSVGGKLYSSTHRFLALHSHIHDDRFYKAPRSRAYTTDGYYQTKRTIFLCIQVIDGVWSLGGDGLFRVKDVRNLLDDNFLPKSNNATRWVKFIPIKVNVFAWKVSMDRLPTRMNLLKRDVYVPDSFCPICKEAAEDSSHLSLPQIFLFLLGRVFGGLESGVSW
ncbi:RNA-directed DNA polymerase, eukaryota [Tanacetum coccineum]